MQINLNNIVVIPCSRDLSPQNLLLPPTYEATTKVSTRTGTKLSTEIICSQEKQMCYFTTLHIYVLHFQDAASVKNNLMTLTMASCNASCSHTFFCV